MSDIYKIALDFFNFDKPCPEQIQNCEKHREEYIRKVKFVDKLGVCTPCEVTNIKNYYIALFKDTSGKI